MVWLSSSHHLIPFTVSFPKMCNSWHSFSHLLFIVPPYQRELRHFGPKYLVVGSCQASKIFFFLFYYKIWAFPPKKNSHQRTSILPSEIGPNPGAHGVLGWSLSAAAGRAAACPPSPGRRGRGRCSAARRPWPPSPPSTRGAGTGGGRGWWGSWRPWPGLPDLGLFCENIKTWTNHVINNSVLWRGPVF